MRALIATFIFMSVPAFSGQLTDCRIVNIEDIASIPVTISGVENSARNLRAISFCHVGSKYVVVNGYEKIINNDEYCYYKISSVDTNRRNFLYSKDEKYIHYQVRYKNISTNCKKYNGKGLVGISLPRDAKLQKQIPEYKNLINYFEQDISFFQDLLDSYSFWGKLFNSSYSDFMKIYLDKKNHGAGTRVISILIKPSIENHVSYEVTILFDNKNWQLDIKQSPLEGFVLIGISSFSI